MLPIVCLSLFQIFKMSILEAMHQIILECLECFRQLIKLVTSKQEGWGGGGGGAFECNIRSTSHF